ncbi:Ig-like domain-containing protein [Mucilaginibacter panaciglaebae]|uniref:BIG2 domain-containing protein n=1 Tax=Mucilaginibacter panaciglaebae TaxID=502331 RepID=A0ABP7WP51_9SPHI
MKKTILKITLAFLSVILLTSCSKKDNKDPSVQTSVTLDSKSVSLHYDESHQFSLLGSGNITTSSYNWISSDVAVGIIDATGKFTAKKIGTATIKAVKGNDSFEAQVTVLPYSTICKEPFWNFNDDIAATKAKESRTLVGQSSTVLMYSGENGKIRNIEYMYGDNSKMSSAAILFDGSTAVIEEAAKFFKERYAYVGEESDVYFYSDNKNVAIGITIDKTLGFIAIYIPYTSNGNTNSLNLKTISGILKTAKKIQ